MRKRCRECLDRVDTVVDGICIVCFHPEWPNWLAELFFEIEAGPSRVTLAGAARRGSAAVNRIVVLANYEARLSGWFLRITRDGETFSAHLAGPRGGDGLTLHRWVSLERILESLESYLVRIMGLPHVWVALRENALAEMAQ